MKRLIVVSFVLLLFTPTTSFSYPNGTLFYVTDAAPFCASCHSAAKAEYTPELPPEFAKKETPEMKHYGLVRMPAPPSPYMELTDEQKETVIKTAKMIDANSSVTITAPLRAKANDEIKVVVKAKGGNGPVIGIMLVDRALRFQSRPITSEGWAIAGEPEVKGQDGKTQKTWLDRRIKGSKRNLNFILVEGQKFDIEKNVYPAGEVTFTLKSPSQAGTYNLTAAFLYGTENAGTAGFFQRPSGRILFSDELSIHVE
ncbi:MAG: hypothetical protein HY578_07555 [Nitrospinae bacterium]|nr:hypothetical protein [Nitrospinota bacterium]